MAAGYSGTPLVKKLGLKEDATAIVDNAPTDYFDLLVGCPDVRWEKRAPGILDCVHIFVTTRSHLERRFPLLVDKLAKTA